MKTLVAVALVWILSSVAWVVLGSTLLARSGDFTNALGRDVDQLWGPPIAQRPPSATIEKAPPAAQQPPEPAAHETLALASSQIDVALDLEHRQKGLIWFPTYVVDFDARYAFDNPSDERARVSFQFPLESEHALYDGFDVQDEHGKSVGAIVERGVARWTAELAPRARTSYRVKYRSRGTTSWQYELTAGTGQVRDFRLALKTDFEQVDFAPGTLSPSSHASSDGSWSGEWKFDTLVASSPIGVVMPERLNPGPLAAKITFFAPVSLLFFFFVVAILARARGHELHPMHYFFMACAFFAFHLLFAYLVDHVSIAPSFAIASVTSVGLVVSYARLFVGWRFALREIGIAQLLYLVLFSFTFFWTGFTGLSVTVGAIVTLFVMMQITGRTRWSAAKLAPERACAAPYRCGIEAPGAE